MDEFREQNNARLRAAPGPADAAIRLSAFHDLRLFILGIPDLDHRSPMDRATAIGEAVHQLAGRLSRHRAFNPPIIGPIGACPYAGILCGNATGLEVTVSNASSTCWNERSASVCCPLCRAGLRMKRDRKSTRLNSSHANISY